MVISHVDHISDIYCISPQVSAFTPVLQRDKSLSGSGQSVRRQNSLSLGRQSSSSSNRGCESDSFN